VYPKQQLLCTPFGPLHGSKKSAHSADGVGVRVRVGVTLGDGAIGVCVGVGVTDGHTPEPVCTPLAYVSYVPSPVLIYPDNVRPQLFPPLGLYTVPLLSGHVVVYALMEDALPAHKSSKSSYTQLLHTKVQSTQVGVGVGVLVGVTLGHKLSETYEPFS
jgi:hypothetical protein